MFIILINITACNSKTRPIIIEKPPVRIAIGGELDESQLEALRVTYCYLNGVPYRDYKHPHPFGFTISSDKSASESASSSLTIQK